MISITPIRYRDESDKGGSPAATPKAASAEDIAAAVLKAVGERTTRAETGVVKSMAEQYGMDEAALKAVLDKHKAEQAAKLPEAAQKQIDEATARASTMLIAAEVKTIGASMGLLANSASAIALLPKEERDKIKVDEKGNVTGAKEALEALQKSDPYLFGSTKPAAMAQKVGGVSPAGLSPVEEAFYRKNPNIKPK